MVRRKTNPPMPDEMPPVTLLIAAYNELDVLIEKIENNSAIDYPRDKLKIVWITDGSDDGSPDILRKYPDHVVYHRDVREGKTSAINRGMQLVDTPFVVFTDANTMINRESIRLITAEFADSKTGCVSGEKRISTSRMDNAVGTGEGFYWRYESFIKKLESDIRTSIGCAGELFGIRTELFAPIEKHVINDDFYISMQVIRKGYRVKYCPEAYAVEKPSINIREELKRKIRIATGGIQSLVMMKDLLNPLKYGFFAFQFLSHKVFRWTVVPLSIFLVFLFNLIIVAESHFAPDIYLVTFTLQVIFYLLVLAGKGISNSRIRLKFFFLPYYLYIMNYSNIAGIWRFIRGSQSVKWEKAGRVK
jgi:biofilm PGA synthesis N-glycosyltransferase PgaC